METYNLSSCVFITAAIFIYSEWLKLDSMVIVRALLNDLKTVSSHGNLFIRQDILPKRFLIILGGWLEFTLMYNGLLSGLLYNLFL